MLGMAVVGEGRPIIMLTAGVQANLVFRDRFEADTNLPLVRGRWF